MAATSLNPNYRVTLIAYNPAGTAHPGDTIIVEAPMPEQFVFDTQATYSPMLPQGMTSGVAATAMAAMGIRLAVPALTAQLWQGSSDINLQLSLEFHTETDPVADVQTPIMNLNRLAMPSINSQSGMLQAPGPSLNFSQLSTVASNAGTEISNFASNVASGSVGVTPTASTMGSALTGVTSGSGSAVTQSSTQNPQLGTSQYWKTQISNQISIRIGQYMYFDSVVITAVQQTFMSNIDAITGLPHHAIVAITFKPLFMLTVEDLPSIFTSNKAPGQSASPNITTLASSGVAIPSAIGGLSGGTQSLVAQSTSSMVPPPALGTSVFTA